MPRIPLFDDADTLSKREAKGARDPLVQSILQYAKLADDAIPLFSRTHADVVIWSDLDQIEAGALADFLIAQGQRWTPIAVVVRAGVATYSYLEVGLITLPRFKRMFSYYLTNGFVLSWNLRLRRAG